MRKRFKVPIIVLLVFFLAIAVTLVIVTRTAWLERRVNALLATALEHKYGLKVKIGDIGGSIFTGFNVSDIEIDHGEDQQRYRVATVKYLQIDYSLSDLLNRRWRLHNLYLDSVVVTLRKKADGGLDLPDFGGDRDGGSRAFDFSVDSIILTNSSFSLQDGPKRFRIDSLSLFSSVSQVANMSQIELNSCSFSLPDFGISRARVSGTVTRVDSLIVAEEMKVITDSSLLFFDLSMSVKDTVEYSAALDSVSLNLRALSRLTGVRIDGDVVTRGNIRGTGDRLDADLVVNGSLIGWKLDDMAARLTYSNSKLTFSSLRGRAFGGRINGSGTLDWGVSPERYRYSGTISNFNLNSLVKGTFETRLSGNITLDGIGLSDSELQLDIKTELGRCRFDEYTFDSASGRVHVNADSIVFTYPYKLSYHSTSVEVGGFIEYTGNMLIQGEADLPVIDEFRDQIFLKEIGGRGRAEFTIHGPVADPSVTASFSSDSVVIHDLTSRDLLGLIDMQHFFTEPTGDAQVFSGEFDYYGLRGDLFQTHLCIEPDRILIDQATVTVAPFDFTVSGRIDIQGDTMLLTLHEFTAEIDSEVIALDYEAVVSFTDSSINILDAGLSRGSDRVTATGAYRYDGSIDFSLTYDSIVIGSWLPHFYARGAGAIDGLLSGTGAFSGTLGSPAFELDVGISDLIYDGQPVGRLATRVTYRDSLLGLNDAVLYGDGNKSTLDGYYPVDLAFEAKESRLLENSPLSLAVSVSGTNFDLLEAIFDDIERFEGRFRIDVFVSGTPGEPLMDGVIWVERGLCKIYYMENLIENISLSGSFDGRDLTITKMDATIARRGKRGTVSASGSISLADLARPEYGVTLKGSNLPIKYDLGDIEFLIERIDLSITGDDPPVVTGNVDIAQFLYQEPFYADYEADAIQAADTIQKLDYNIHISIPRNMWIKNEDADVELQGDLTILKEGRLENFLGELEIVRGNFYLPSLNRTFELEPGGKIIFDNIEKFNPLLEDVRMTTTIRDSSGARTICLQISDSLENPRIDVCPESDYTIDEVWVYMNPIGGAFSESDPSDTLRNGAGSSIADRITVGATGIAINQASRYISRQLGVERFELTTPTYGRDFNPLETELAIGFYTTPRLYIYGTSQLSFSKAQELGFDYRLSKRVFISGRRDRENLYEFDVNLNWDFK